MTKKKEWHINQVTKGEWALMSFVWGMVIALLIIEGVRAGIL
jgi:hypothetical protein